MSVSESTQVERHVSVDRARSIFAECISAATSVESIPITAADGRILAADISANRNVPHYDRAAMDGFAVRAAETEHATDEAPVSLSITDGPVEPGTARGVDTGCPIPSGATAVARIEKTIVTDDVVDVLESIPPGKDIAPVGEDVAAGDVLARAGDQLTPAVLGVFRSLGIESVPVRVPPTVAIVPTGDEIVTADPAPGELIESNGLMVQGYATRWGASVKLERPVPDDRSAVVEALETATEADLIVTIGGSSVGNRDLLPEVVADIGQLHVHHVSIKPGHPVGIARVSDTPLIMLPGYPVACVINAVQFLRPACYWLQDASPPAFPTYEATVETTIESDLGIRRFERIRRLPDRNSAVVTPVGKRGSGSLTSVTTADGWLVIPEDCARLEAGTPVTVTNLTGPSATELGPQIGYGGSNRTGNTPV